MGIRRSCPSLGKVALPLERSPLAREKSGLLLIRHVHTRIEHLVASLDLSHDVDAGSRPIAVTKIQRVDVEADLTADVKDRHQHDFKSDLQVGEEEDFVLVIAVLVSERSELYKLKDRQTSAPSAGYYAGRRTTHLHRLPGFVTNLSHLSIDTLLDVSSSSRPIVLGAPDVYASRLPSVLVDAGVDRA